MSQVSTTALASDEPTTQELPGPNVASENTEQGRGHGIGFILWLLEQSRLTLLAIPTVIAAIVTYLTHGGPLLFALTFVAVPLAGILLPVLLIIYKSHQHDAGAANWDEFISFRDPKVAARWAGKKIP